MAQGKRQVSGGVVALVAVVAAVAVAGVLVSSWSYYDAWVPMRNHFIVQPKTSLTLDGSKRCAPWNRFVMIMNDHVFLPLHRTAVTEIYFAVPVVSHKHPNTTVSENPGRELFSVLRDRIWQDTHELKLYRYHTLLLPASFQAFVMASLGPGSGLHISTHATGSPLFVYGVVQSDNTLVIRDWRQRMLAVGYTTRSPSPMVQATCLEAQGFRLAIAGKSRALLCSRLPPLTSAPC